MDVMIVALVFRIGTAVGIYKWKTVASITKWFPALFYGHRTSILKKMSSCGPLICKTFVFCTCTFFALFYVPSQQLFNVLFTFSPCVFIILGAAWIRSFSLLVGSQLALGNTHVRNWIYIFIDGSSANQGSIAFSVYFEPSALSAETKMPWNKSLKCLWRNYVVVESIKTLL